MSLAYLPYDRQLARRLARQARAAAKEQVRAEIAFAKQVRRRERVLAQARRGLPRQTLVAAGAAAATWPLDGGWAWAAMTTSAIAGLGAWNSLQTLRRPPQPPQPVAAAAPLLPPPPPRRSATFPAIWRLEVVREELRRLLPLVAPAGRDAATEAWQAAAEADLALRWQASRLAAVEPHRGVDAELLGQLEAGVAAQERVVTAVADLVAASADPLATGRLQDATDRVHGLAQGLLEVR